MTQPIRTLVSLPTADGTPPKNYSGVLADWQIAEHVKITPLAEGVKRPGVISYGTSGYGYDARLGETVKLFTPAGGFPCVDPKAISPKAFVDAEVHDGPTGRYVIVPPHSYALGETVEHFEVPRDVICVCLGKSTYARCAIIANVTPLEPAWRGKITIEISNSSPLPVKVYVGEGIVQILFLLAAADCAVSYADKGGKYQDQTGLTLPKVDTTEAVSLAEANRRLVEVDFPPGGGPGEVLSVTAIDGPLLARVEDDVMVFDDSSAKTIPHGVLVQWDAEHKGWNLVLADAPHHRQYVGPGESKAACYVALARLEALLSAGINR